MRDLKEEILGRIGGDSLAPFVESLGFALQRSSGEYKFLCPFHDDHRPSCTLNTRKKPGGIFKCFSCGWGGDVFQFVGDLRGVSDFRGQLVLIAEQLGIDTEGKRSEAPVDFRPSVRERLAKQVQIEPMSPREVLGVYRDHKANALEPEPWCEQINVSPVALEMIGGVVVEMFDRTVLVVPMRRDDGCLTSLRYRCFETKKRWSVDVKGLVDGVRQQIKTSTAGLMADFDFFDPDICIDHMVTVVIEGETDLLAALTMMIRDFGTDSHEWPARWCALPGVNSCHDLLLGVPMTNTVLLFFDDDEAGHTAVFDHRRMITVEGQRQPVLDQPPTPGLLAKLVGKQVRAAFPPRAPYLDAESLDRKYDLRDMIRDGWTWHRFFAHCIDTGTADRFGMRLRRERRKGIRSGPP